MWVEPVGCREVSATHAAVGLSLVQSLEELIDGRVRQPDGGRRRRQRALRHKRARAHKKLFHCCYSCSHTDCRRRPGSYLDPQVLVSPPQQGVHILQYQLGGGVQKVKVQVETQQRRGVHLLARRGGGGGVEKKQQWWWINTDTQQTPG